jgi:hypothetical protein
LVEYGSGLVHSSGAAIEEGSSLIPGRKQRFDFAAQLLVTGTGLS